MVMIFGEITTGSTVNYEQVRDWGGGWTGRPAHSSGSGDHRARLCIAACVVPGVGNHICVLQLSDELNVDLVGLGRAPLQVIRDAVKEIGYDDPGKGLDYNTMNVIVAIEEQSPDIAQSVDSR
jgi:S-adenosylmethionine synthetase